MGLVTNRRLARILRREAERRGATVLPYVPTEVYIDPCNVCDLRCTFCPQSSWGHRERGVMSQDLYRKAVEQAAALRPQRLNLFCYGEALLHKEIGPMIRHAVEQGLWVRIHTNAKSLDEAKARTIIESGLSEIRFSFDTGDPALYNRLRVRSDFDTVLGNILGFLRIRKEMGAKRPLVFLQEMVPYEAGVKARNTEAYRRLFDGWDVIFTARHMHNFAGGSSEKEFAGIPKLGTSSCREIYRRLVVTFDGKVHACCLDAEGHNIVGDLSKGDTIADAWNSPAMQRIRHLTNTRQLEGLKPCDTCDQLCRTRRPPSPPQIAIGSIAWFLRDPLLRRRDIT